MDTAASHPLPDILSSDYQPFSVGEFWVFYFSGLSQSIRTDAHRATMNTNGPSKLFRFTFPGMTPVLVLLRSSNEVTDDPSKLARYLFRDGV